MQKFFLSCDWGTTAFRLRLVDTANFAVIAEAVSGEGIFHTHDQWKKQHAVDGCAREEFYLYVLRQRAEVLEQQSGTSLAGTILIVSGMASSSIGIRELPYASLPFSLDGSDAFTQIIQTDDTWWGKVILVSGVRSERDVMRGEETQMIGLSSLLPADQEVTSIFPGTHSKHLTIRAGALVDIQTYITGELFHLMANQSILKEGVLASSRPMDEEDTASFGKGIDQSKEFNLLNSLFSVRVNHLFGSLDKEQNFYFLSGLLIGSELMDLEKKRDLRIQLCSGSNLYGLYKLAIEKSGLAGRTAFVSPAMMDMAVVRGQWEISGKLKDQ